MTDNRPRCRERHVPDGGRWPTFHQCTRLAVRDGYCKQHHPDAVRERRQRSHDQSEARWQERRLEIYGKSAIGLLREIAKGHNDPCNAAREWLRENKFEESGDDHRT